MAEHRDEDELDRRTLEAWEVDAPPAGFADRVIASMRAEAAPAAPRPRRPWIYAAAAALLLAAAIAVLVWPRGGIQRGAVTARERTSLELAGRGVAVLEPGAGITFRAGKGGDAHITQSEGDVFYRVEPGGPFVVETPAGRVQVQGTCFRVEVIPMRPSKQALVGAGVGAALSAAVVVTVYEGKVLLANDKGTRAVAAGERGTMTPGAAPGVATDGKTVVMAAKPAPIEEIPAPAAGATREELLERDRLQREELARLRVRVRDLEGEVASGAKKRRRLGEAVDAPFVDPTPEQLMDMARACQAQWDWPPLGPDELLDKQRAEHYGLSEEERAIVNRAHQVVTERVTTQLRAIYIEVTGDAANAENLGAEALLRDIEEKSPRRDREEAVWRISQERAGLLPVPTDLGSRPPVERAIRIMLAIGDLFEQELAKGMGAERAHELRKADDGWPAKGISTGCPDDKPSLAPPKEPQPPQ